MATQIGLQIYTVRNFLKTPADIAKTLARVKKIGYDAIELAGLGPIEPQELGKIMSGEGLTCCSRHVSVNDLRSGMQKIIDDSVLWQCPYVIIASFNPREQTAQGWADFASDCNSMAKQLEVAKLTLGYHNHSAEFVHYDGKPALQILLEHVSPQVAFEVDVHWVVRGGGDPAQWIEKLSGHIPCIHMKDMVVVAGDRNGAQFAEVGEGNLNWPAILAAAKKSGVKWHIVEQDDTYGRDVFDCIEKSLQNMKQMGLS